MKTPSVCLGPGPCPHAKCRRNWEPEEEAEHQERVDAILDEVMEKAGWPSLLAIVFPGEGNDRG